MNSPRQATRFALGLSVLFLAGCGALLPRGEIVAESPWRSFGEAQQTFDNIIAYKTTVEDLRKLKLDPLGPFQGMGESRLPGL